ncbi:MAG: PilW family protein [Halanaerobium sp.]
MSNLLKISNDNQGFTLIELLIVMAIFVIVIFAVGNLITSSSGFFFRDNERIEVQRELRFITNYIDENLKFADEVEVYSSKPAAAVGESLIGFENSYLVLEDASGSSRKISNVVLADFNVSSTEGSRNLELAIEHADGLKIDTSILLNNHSAENTVTDGKYIKFKN